MDVVTLLTAAVLPLIIYFWFPRSDPRLPPFPIRPLPILGNLLSMDMDTRSVFPNWRKKCGDIFSLKLGGTHVVVLNGYDLIKETLVTKGDVCSDRPSYFLDLATRIPVKGIVFVSGEIWKEQRSVALSILRSFGMGTNVLAEKVIIEKTYLLEYLASLKGKPTNIQTMLYISVSNVICSILIGQRFEYENTQFQDIMYTVRAMFSDQMSLSLVNFISWLKFLPGDLFKAKSIASRVQKLMRMVTMFAEKKKRDVVDSSDIDNFIDAYMYEMNKRVKAGMSTSLDGDSLKKIMFELFLGATDTTSVTIYWFVLYMIVYPSIQEKVYQEIKHEVGTGRTPNIQDRNQLTYLNAVIHETQRLASIIPHSITHMCSEEVTLRGYTLPKGTAILPNLDSVLYDKATWGEDAMSFRPERFIDDNGKLKIPEQFIPFGIGRRMCLGESLAKMQLFLFISSMFQKFQFIALDAMNPPTTDYVPQIIVSPISYEVIVVERN